MTLTAAERRVVASVAPFPIRGIPEDQLGEYLDAWFAHDHYDDNPAYMGTNNESFHEC